MIKTFANRIAEAAWQRRYIKAVSREIMLTANRKLTQIHSAQNLDDLRLPPGNRLEALSGKRKGQFSIRINDQWRVCFRWHENDAYDVEVVDYH